MAITEWTFPVQANDTGKKEYLVRTAAFGDGYAQTSGEGINSHRKSWAITFSGQIEDVQEVIAFLDERKGYQSFIWKDPFGLYGLYKATSYDVLPYAKDVFRLTTMFEQAFAP